jgi:hypothetical protein
MGGGGGWIELPITTGCGLQGGASRCSRRPQNGQELSQEHVGSPLHIIRAAAANSRMLLTEAGCSCSRQVLATAVSSAEPMPNN